MIIGILGIAGSGKDTIADYLVENYNYKKDSFAKSLKDATAVMFNWDREMLEGSTPESRAQREIPDQWWSEKLEMSWSPRIALQHLGTNVLRKKFYDGIWLSSLENRLLTAKHNTVISDVRFPNEVELIRRSNGILICVERGEQPEWQFTATQANRGESNSRIIMQTKYSDVHESEWAWSGTETDYTIDNNSSYSKLYKQVDKIITTLSPETIVVKSKPHLTLV